MWSDTHVDTHSLTLDSPSKAGHKHAPPVYNRRLVSMKVYETLENLPGPALKHAVTHHIVSLPEPAR